MLTAKDSLKALLRSTNHLYGCDLAASSPETMGQKPGGAHRCPFDFTYELVQLNHMMATRLRGDTPPERQGGAGYMTAPPEFCNVEDARKQLSASIDDVIAAIDEMPEDGLTETVELFGKPMTKLQIATICGIHMAYHDGQLNYVQTAGGDLDVHWTMA